MKLKHTSGSEDEAIDLLRDLDPGEIIKAIEGLDTLLTDRIKMLDARDDTIRDLTDENAALRKRIEELEA